MGTPDLSGPVWRTSRHSNAESECVEVAVVPGYVGVRDSKDRSGPALVFAPFAWRAFVQDVQVGSFDHG